MMIDTLKRGLLIGIYLVGGAPLIALSGGAQQDLIIINNVTVINVRNGVKTAADILISGEKIIGLEPNGNLTGKDNLHLKNAQIVDATGQYAIPGLWDMHVHLTKNIELRSKISSLFVANGVTSVRDLGAEVDDILSFIDNSTTLGNMAPQIWAAGPMLDGTPPVFDGKPDVSGPGKIDPAMSMQVETPADGIALVDKLAEHGFKLIKPYETLRPDVFSAIAKRANKHGLLVDGHIPMRMTILEAMEAGINGVQHLKGVPAGCSINPQNLKEERIKILDKAAKDARGVDLFVEVFTTVVPKALAQQDPVRCNKLIEAFVDMGIWHTPTLSTERFFFMSENERSVWEDSLKYLPESFRIEVESSLEKIKSLPTIKVIKNKYKWKREMVDKMHRAGVNFLAGTDTPALLIPGFSLHDELAALVEQGGLSPLASLQAATLNPAKFFNIEDSQGSIEVGMVADILLLDANPLLDINNTRQLNTVILRGKILDRSALNLLLSK